MRMRQCVACTAQCARSINLPTVRLCSRNGPLKGGVVREAFNAAFTGEDCMVLLVVAAHEGWPQGYFIGRDR